MIKRENILEVNKTGILINSLIPLNTKNKEFSTLMELYDKARSDILEKLNIIKEYFKEIYEYDVINHITSRIKTPESILKKMQKKHYELTYKDLIENINDIAGIRVICTFKDDILKIRKIIGKMPNVRIIKEKDYIKNPKKSGYMGYHIILENYIKYDDTYVPVKVEIQIRTMAMDFWATTEHKIKYKKNHKLSTKDSKKMEIYAKIINILDDKIMKIYQKQVKEKIEK